MTHRTPATRNRWAAFAIAALLACYWVMAVSTSPRVGVTGDESVHLTAGYAHWRFNDYRLDPENGTLGMRFAALPLLGMGLNWVPFDDPDWRHSYVNRVAHLFFFRLGNSPERMLLAARAMVALIGVFTAWLIWRWTRALFGPIGGGLALALAVFSPTLLAHGALATADLAITAAFLVVATAFWRVLHVLTWPRLLLATLAGGAVLLAKMSGVLAAPMLAALLVARWFRSAPLPVRLGGAPRLLRRRGAVMGTTLGLSLLVALGSLGIVWAGYGFRFSAFASPHREGAALYFSWPEILDEVPIVDPWPGDAPSALRGAPVVPTPSSVSRALRWALDHRVLPEAYLWGFAQTYKFSRSRPAFLDGEFRLTGWKTFFPRTFWLKTTLPTLVLFAAGTAAVLTGGVSRRRWLYRAAPLLAIFAVYWAVALQTKLNIGHRHILPTYPTVFVLAGAAARWLRRWPGRLWGTALVIAVAAHAGDSLAARPFYLAYFQPLAGGQRQGWRHLVDSSYDWGQGLPDLTRWLEQQAAAGDRTPVYLTYSGADSPRERRLPVIRFADEISDFGERVFPVRPRGGWFAISATHFQRVYLDIHGPWNDRYEQLYQQLRAEVAKPNPPASDAAAQARMLRAAMDFEVLEFGRLCRFLRERAPDGIIGASILLFRLTDREVALALEAPLPELDRAAAAVAHPR